MNKPVDKPITGPTQEQQIFDTISIDNNVVTIPDVSSTSIISDTIDADTGTLNSLTATNITNNGTYSMAATNYQLRNLSPGATYGPHSNIEMWYFQNSAPCVFYKGGSFYHSSNLFQTYLSNSIVDGLNPNAMIKAPNDKWYHVGEDTNTSYAYISISNDESYAATVEINQTDNTEFVHVWKIPSSNNLYCAALTLSGQLGVYEFNVSSVTFGSIAGIIDHFDVISQSDNRAVSITHDTVNGFRYSTDALNFTSAGLTGGATACAGIVNNQTNDFMAVLTDGRVYTRSIGQTTMTHVHTLSAQTWKGCYYTRSSVWGGLWIVFSNGTRHAVSPNRTTWYEYTYGSGISSPAQGAVLYDTAYDRLVVFQTATQPRIIMRDIATTSPPFNVAVNGSNVISASRASVQMADLYANTITVASSVATFYSIVGSYAASGSSVDNEVGFTTTGATQNTAIIFDGTSKFKLVETGVYIATGSITYESHSGAEQLEAWWILSNSANRITQNSNYAPANTAGSIPVFWSGRTPSANLDLSLHFSTPTGRGLTGNIRIIKLY